MKSILRFIVVIFTFIISACVLGRNLSVDQYLPMQVSDRVITANSMRLSLGIAAPKWSVAGSINEQVTTAEYDLLCGFIEENGLPFVPVINRSFRLPPGKIARVEVIDVEFETLDDVDYAAWLGGTTLEELGRMKSPEDSWFPRKIAEVSNPSYYRDFRVSNLLTYPVQVNTARREVRVYSRIEVDIAYEFTDDPNANTQYPTAISRTFLPWYRRFLDWDENELNDYTLYRGGVQVIMRDDELLFDALEPWIEWKLQKGWELEFLTDSDVQFNPPQIQNELRVRYNESETKFDFVVIIGDNEGIFSVPVGIKPIPDADGNVGDYYYSLMNPEDQFQDVIVGRISVMNVLDVNKYVAKVLSYERDPYMEDTDWYLNGACLAVTSYSGVSTANTAYYVEQELYDIGYDTVGTEVGYSIEPARSNTINNLNDGVSYYHCRTAQAYGLSAAQIHNLTNNNMLFAATDITCRTGDWHLGESISEAYVRVGTVNSPRGAIGALGLAGGSNTGLNNALVGGAHYAALRLHLPELGQMIFGAQDNLLNAYRTRLDYARLFCEKINLIGDPLVWLWTAIPAELNVDASEIVSVGANTYSVEVTDEDDEPVEGAWVTFYKVDDDEEVIARGLSGHDGTVILNIPVRHPGDAMLTVTKQNFHPNRIEVEVLSPNERVGYVEAVIVDDGQNGTEGNDNGVAEAGETIGISFTVHNFGNNTQSNIAITAESDDDWIDEIDGEITVDELDSGEETTGAELILLEIAPEAQNDWNMNLELEFDSDEGTYEDGFSFQVFAPEYIFVQVTDNEDLEPGETAEISIQLKNIGGSNAAISEGYLNLIHPYGEATDPTGDFPAMSIDAMGTAQFTISAHEESFNGFICSAQMVVTSEIGQVDTVIFSIPLGSRSSTDPSGPDRYGYYALDNTDSDYQRYPEFDWVEVNPDDDNNDFDGTELDLDDRGDDQDECIVIALPFQVQFYGETFDSITVSTNGWAALGSQGQYYGAMKNWPIPAPLGPYYMLAPYWDERTFGNISGIFAYYDEDNYRFVIEWYRVDDFYSNASCTFEIIIFDQREERLTYSGDNDILFQYGPIEHTGVGFSDTWWWTTGIEDGTQTDGIQYYYWREPSPGAVDLGDFDDGLAILFTTDVVHLFGSIEGTISDLATDDPVDSVLVTIGDNLLSTYSDPEGHYIINDILIGEYSVSFENKCFTDTTFNVVEIIENDTTTINLLMRRPEITVDPDIIEQELLPDEVVEYEFAVINNGNGPLEYSAHLFLDNPPNFNIQLEDDGLDFSSPWADYFEYELDQDESRHRGVVMIDRYILVTGSNNFDPVGPNKFYQYSRFEGELLGVHDQPVPEEYRTAGGIFGVAYDGEYIYGVEDSRIHQMVFEPGVGEEEDTIYAVDSWEIELEETRYLAYDPDRDLFWMGNLNLSIYAVNRDGEIVEEFEQVISPRGASWNPYDEIDYNLYLTCRLINETVVRMIRMNPLTGDYLVMHEYDTNDVPSGADFTSTWHPLVQLYVTLMDNREEDYLRGWFIGSQDSYFEIINPDGVLAGDSETDINIIFRSLDLPIGEYSFYIGFENNACEDESNIVSITMSVPDTTEIPDKIEASTQPLEWAFKGAYPNPFNPTVNINFSLKHSVEVQARIYNLLGQEVAVLADNILEAGQHTLTFEGMDMASGMYFLKFKAGPLSEMRKLILIK
ncbi:MAG: C25 family cysteine peptidase [Candidatus Electryonea clarkiae]|nr:C25 family cysteine peptidase [Candidatus Electryonea clarkiae]MDP8285286.1 C25 family cysteine peptidase [Candidatus Electryonea clarkiae]